MKKYNCIIIGAGLMGALKPDNIDSPITVNILTHAHAIEYIKELNLMAIIDPDYDKLKQAGNKWNTAYFASIHYFKQIYFTPVDIVTIATPPETHFKVIKEAVEKIKPKIIICEKPFCNSLEEAEQAIKLCEENNIKLIVHYNRRYCNLFAVANMIYNGDYGNVLSCICTYTRGLKRKVEKR